MRRRLDSVERSPSSPAMRSLATSRLIDLVARDGRLAEMRRMDDRAFTIDSLRGVNRDRLADEAVLASVEAIATGSGTRASQRLDSLLALAPLRTHAVRPDLRVAAAFAVSGRPDRARAILKAYDAEVTDTALRRVQEPVYRETLGEVLIAERRPKEAMAEFRRADIPA